MPRCADYDELISAYADGQTVPAQSEFVQAHLTGCARCSALLRRQRETRALIAALDDERWTPPDLRLRIAVAQQRPARGARAHAMAISGLGAGLIVLAAGIAAPRLAVPGRAAQPADRALVAAVQGPSGPCDSCEQPSRPRYVRLYGRSVPEFLMREVAGELATAHRAATGTVADAAPDRGHDGPKGGGGYRGAQPL